MKRVKTLRSLIVLLILGAASVVQAQDVPPQRSRTPGPYIIPIDYDALYEMKEPPAYEPFEVYGWFLLSVANQQSPMVVNPWMPVPERVIKTADVMFKEVDGITLGLDVYQPKGDSTPNPLILIIHGGYWKSGDKSVHVYNGVEFTDLGYTVGGGLPWLAK